jgi:RNA polymerase sigma-70 factor (ECF subfamily)
MPYTNEDIIDSLYKLYEHPLYYEAYKILHDAYLAEDAVHEAFLRLIRNRNKISDPRSPLVRSYVYKTLRSAALDLYRRQKKLQENCLPLDETIENTLTDER